MSETPSGDAGTQSIRIERVVAAPREDLWLWFTESDRTAQWIGPWHYTDQAAGQIGLELVAEEGTPASSATIGRCEAPRVLEVTTEDSAGVWHLQVSLEPAGAGGASTRLTFEHFDVPVGMLTDIRAGWNFYLDTMLAAKDGLEKPVFEDYLEPPSPGTA
ncbi:SRPBCC domain-containing protein [Pseudoclavibacter terrae]|uniref:SRPBCC domain-containing protein n=1 Tax=Pseudoclavibacter terrae TaxID=1530195 RepID=UPI00232B33F0|nr:SRPBCC domain-containing protein [Pseudoclavibacter terrae]